jgi:hypothetical protein
MALHGIFRIGSMRRQVVTPGVQGINPSDRSTMSGLDTVLTSSRATTPGPGGGVSPVPDLYRPLPAKAFPPVSTPVPP